MDLYLPRRRELAINIVLALIYFIAGKLGLQLAFVNESATVVWPPTGIAIASFLLLGYRIWPAIFIGAFLTNFTTNGAVLISLGIALGNTLEGIIAALLVNKLAGGKEAFYKVSGYFKFFLLAGVLSTAISADIGVITLILGGAANWSEFGPIWLTWWTGDLSGALIVTPFIIYWSNRKYIQWGPKKIVEAVIVFLALIIVGYAVFSNLTSGYSLVFLCLPMIIWIAFRLGLRATTTSIIALSIIAIVGTLSGQGPFLRDTPNRSLFSLQAFMDIVAISAVALAIAVVERRRLDERFVRVLDNMIEGFQIIGFDWKYKYVNDSIVKQGKSTREKLLGHTMMEVYPGIEETEVFAQLKRAMVERVPHKMETEFKFPDGTTGWFELRIEPIPEGIFVLSLDATERKRQQEVLKREASIIENATEAIIGKTLDGIITSWNKGAEALYGYTEEEVIGKSNTILIPPAHIDEWEGIREKLLRGEDIKNFETQRITKNGRVMDVSMTYSPIKDENGTITGTSAIVRDITERKKIDSMKNEFVALASHQLKTPLTSIKWYSELLLKKTDSNFSEKQLQYLREIHKSNKRMIYLINALLNVSRIDLGTFIIDPKEANLIEIVESVLEDFEVQINSRNLAIEKNFDNSIQSVVLDINVMRIIVSNLLSNAIRYSENNGTIGIEVRRDEYNFFVKVWDRGIGIPNHQKDKIFKKFSRADNAMVKNTDGSGLGLYIVKSLINQTGGSINFESEENQGTSFTVLYPMSGMKEKEGSGQPN